MKIKANSRADLEALVYLINNIPKDDRCQLAAVITFLRIMLVPIEELQRAIDLIIATGDLEKMKSFYLFLSVVDPDALDRFFEGTIHHILNGTDTEDADSVGGWSQREINLLLASFDFEAHSSHS